MTTLLSERLAQRIDRKVGQVEQVGASFMDWSLDVPEPKGRLDFERFPFQRQFYTDEVGKAKEVAMQKGTQLGLSAWLLRNLLWLVDTMGVVALLVFPKYRQVMDFSGGRVRTSIQRSDRLRKRVSPDSLNNYGYREIGAGSIYFRGSEAVEQLDSVDADVLGLDEYSMLANVPVAEYRISGSQLGLTRRIGVPILPNKGIARVYPKTDRRQWLVKCRSGHELPLRWTTSIDHERQVRVCAECHAELRPEDVAAGRWVAENPEAAIIGYKVPRLIMPEIDVPAMIEASERTLPEERQAFWNRALAEPYAPAEGRLSPDAIAAATSHGEAAGSTANAGGYVGHDLITMGVDVASVRDLNVRISRHLEDGRRVALYVGTKRNFDEVAALMDGYGVHVACIDHLPEGRLARQFTERFPGRAYLIAFANIQQGHVLTVDEGTRFAKVRRLEAIDATLDAVRTSRNLLPPNAPPEYGEHLQNIVRQVETDSQGRKVVRYEDTGPIDYLMAEVYDLCARGIWDHHMHERAIGYGEVESYADRMEFERSALHEDEPVLREQPLSDEYG